MRTPKYKSEIVDAVIVMLEEKMKRLGRHLLKTETIYRMVCNQIDISDDSEEKEELLEIGIKQVIQSRLYCRGYFSVFKGYFVNVEESTNLAYLNMVVNNKDKILDKKADVRNQIKKRINELTGLNGQLTLVPDENNLLIITENKTEDELLNDLEADAV